MLGCGGHAVPQVIALEALDVGGPDGPREHRILTVGLLYPSPTRVTSDIEHRSKCVPGTDCHHLGADDLGHLFDQDRVPGCGQPDALREDRRIPMAEPTGGLLVDDDRDAQPRPFDGHLLDSVHKRGTLLWMQTSRGTDTGHLPNTERHLLDDSIGIEGFRTHESGTPEAAELGQLLIQSHESEQVLDSLFNGGVRITIEWCGQMSTPC